jgi:hypothetical protein
VSVRCRPLNSEERKAGLTPAVTCDLEAKTVNVAYGNSAYLRKRNLVFDHVFGPYSRQEEVFDTLVRPIIDETLSGEKTIISAHSSLT